MEGREQCRNRKREGEREKERKATKSETDAQEYKESGFNYWLCNQVLILH